MSFDTMTPSTIAAQEDAMWAEYRAEQQAIAQTPVDETLEEESVAEEVAMFPQARCELSPQNFRQYPAQKPGTTTKDRRYMAQRVKYTDRGKALGKRPGPSSKSYQQIKSEGFPHSDV